MGVCDRLSCDSAATVRRVRRAKRGDRFFFFFHSNLTIPSPLSQVGALLTYTLDAARAREGALASAWATLCLTNVALLLTRSPCPPGRPLSLCLGAAAFNGATLGAAGVWATLQFRWVQAHYPVACLALERALLAGAGPLGTAAAGLVALSALSPAAAPFGTLAAAGGFFLALGRPLPSSFPAIAGRGGASASSSRRRGAGGPGGCATTPGDSARAALLFALLPLAQHLCMSRRVLFTPAPSASGAVARSDAFWAALLLASLPWVVLALARDGLAWGGRGRKATRAARRLVLLVAAPAAVAGLEGRILRRAVGPYLALPPPWSYIALTAALAPVAAFGCAQAAGLLEADEDAAGGSGPSAPASSDPVAHLPRSAAAAGPVLVMAAGAAGLAAGLPLWALPAPLAAAAGLALFWESGAGADYALFAAGAAGCGAWFVGHHFWFLDVPLGAGHTLRSACAIAGCAGVAALAVPGLLNAGRAGWVGGGGGKGAPAHPAPSGPRHLLAVAALLAQAALVSLLEDHLFAGDHADPEAAPELYPAYLVVATSLAGVAAARAAARAGLVAPGGAWLLQCVWGAKAALLALPASRPVGPVLGCVLAATAPAALWGRSSGGQDGDASAVLHGPPPSPTARLMLAALAVAAALRARFIVFDALQEYGYGGSPPVDGAVAGALAAAVAGVALPALWVRAGEEEEGGGTTSRRPRTTPATLALALARRATAALLAAGLAALALEPPQPRRLVGADGCPAGLPSGLCPRLWDPAHAPDHYSPGDVTSTAWGADGLDRRGGGPAAWLLVGAAGAAAASAAVSAAAAGGRDGPSTSTTPAPSPSIGGPGTALAALAAGSAGAYVAGSAFSGAPLALHACVCGSVVAAAGALVALLRARPRRGAAWAPRCLGGWAVALGAAAWVRSSAPPPLPPAAATLFPDAGHAAAADAEAAGRAALAALAAAECLLLALGLKLRVGRALGSGGGVLGGGDGGGPGLGPSSTAPLAAGAREAWAAAGGAAASFLGACLPGGAAPGAHAAASRRGPSGGPPSSTSPGAAAASAAGSAGLRWAPTAGNLLALAGTALAAGPVADLWGRGPPLAAILLSPALLLLGPDPALFAGLSDGRRYAPPFLGAAAALAARALADLAQDRAARTAFTGWVHEAAAAAALKPALGPGAGDGPGALVREGLALLGALPGVVGVTLAAWQGGGATTTRRGSPGGPSPFALLALATPALVSLAAGQLGATKWLAAWVLAGCVGGVVGQRRAGRVARRGGL